MTLSCPLLIDTDELPLSVGREIVGPSSDWKHILSTSFLFVTILFKQISCIWVLLKYNHQYVCTSGSS